MTGHRDTSTFIVGDTGYVAEVVGIALELAITIDGLVGEGHALALASRLGLSVAATAIDSDAIPAQCSVIVTLGPPATREDFVRSLTDGQVALTLVHPDTSIGPAVEIGAGTLVSPGARLAAAIVVGSHCLIHTSAVLSHDDLVGDFVTISPSATLTGGVQVGDRASIGAGATILPGITIGNDAVIGAGAVVTRDVAPGTVVAGIPARTRIS